MVRTKKQKEVGEYSVILELNGEKGSATGLTLVEAFNNLVYEVGTYKTKGILKIEKDGRKIEKIFGVLPLKRFFANKLTREIWAKNLDLALK